MSSTNGTHPTTTEDKVGLLHPTVPSVSETHCSVEEIEEETKEQE